MIAWYQGHRFTVLFTTLLATLVVVPLLGMLGLDVRLLDVFVALNLVIAAMGISNRAHYRYLLLGVAVVAAGARLLPVGQSGGLATPADLLWVFIAALAAVGAVRFALSARSVDREHVSAAFSAYLLAGLVFAVLYVAVERVWPGSFADQASGGGGFTLSSAIYFSYVTLATLGYGDVVPRVNVARGLAVVEALGAQLYLTVTVARLVSLYVRDSVAPPTGRPSD